MEYSAINDQPHLSVKSAGTATNLDTKKGNLHRITSLGGGT